MRSTRVCCQIYSYPQGTGIALNLLKKSVNIWCIEMYYLYIHNIVFAVQLQAQCITCTVTKCNFPKMFNCFCILAIFKRLVWSQQRHSIIKIVQIQIWKIKLDEKFHEDNEVVLFMMFFELFLLGKIYELPSRTRNHNLLITGSTFWSNFNNIIK